MGTKSQKKAKTRLDAYYRLAKDQGYRSRAAYKLIQLNRKYDFLSKSRSVVDLCAAPGGWCQVAAKFMPMGSKVVGVDLVPIPPIRGVKTFVGDITEDKTRKMVMTYLKKEPVDCVIHDGAGNVGGVWSKDLFAQNALTLASLKFACSVLRAGGWFISKVFRSGDFQKIMWVLKQFFDKVEATKPLASRMESAEIFVVCAGYKAPKTIDPKLFSAQHIFSDVGTEKVMNQSGVLVTPKNNVPQGYEKFNTIESNIATMDEFLRAENPKEFLKAMHEIRFGDEDKKYLKHKSAKKELVYLCQDLQQVGEGDRKKLIRWRDQVLRAFPQAAVGPADADDDVNSAGAVSDYDSEDGVHVMPDEDQLDDEARAAAAAKGTADDAEAIATELLRIRKAHEKEMKRKQKKLIDRKLKQVRGLINHDPYEAARHPTDMGGGDGFEADANDDEMEEGDWAMGSLKKLGEDDMADAFDEMYEEPDEGLNLPINIPMDVNVNEENEMQMGGDEFAEDGRLQIEEGNEEAYDVDAYGNYVVAERAERAAAFDDPMDASSEDEDEEREDPAEKKKRIRRERDEEALDEAGAQAKWQRRHLNIDQVLNRTFPKPRDSKASKKEAAKKARTEEERIQMRAPALPKAGKVDKKKRRAASSDSDSDSEVVEHPLHDEHGITDSDDDDVGSEFDEMSDFSDDEGAEGQGASYGKSSRLGKDQKRVLLPTASFLTTQEKVKQQRKDIDKTNKEKRKARKDKKNLQKEGKKKKKKKGEEGKEDTTFEEIPLAMADPEVRDRTLAMATAMLDKNTRTQMLENGINKFMHNDDDDLPDWFIKDENRNCILQMPITAEEVERQRARFKEMNARPSKKVAEAVGRKRKKAQRTLRKLLDKGRTDPKSREKTAGLSIRKLMRSKDVRGTPNKKKNQAFDNKNKGEAKRERQRLKKQGGAGKKGGGKKGGRR